MDLTPFFNGIFRLLIWLIPALILIAILKSSLFKGWFGELLVKISTKLFLPADEYHAFHNVTLPTPDGTTQIDHIFVSEFGIFVVETKNMTGWIFGSERQPQWTQKIYKQTYRFQNPLRQNYKHVKALESVLDLPREVFHSVVVFVGGCAFKTPMPSNVTEGGGLISFIKSTKNPILTPEQIAEATRIITTERLIPSLATNREHVSHLDNRSHSNSIQICPKCGSEMVLRTAKKGRNFGQRFWGCSRFPRCRAVINPSDP